MRCARYNTAARAAQGLALAGLFALAGCGQHSIGDSGTSAPVTNPALTCSTLAAPAAGYGVGVCQSTTQMATVFVAAATAVTVTSADTAAPQYTLVLDSAAAAGEDGSVSFTAANIASNPRLGAYTGLRMSRQVGATAADLAELNDFRISTLSGSSTTSLTYGSFGSWTRYTTSAMGYEGVWFTPIVDQTNVKVPTTGSVSLSGVAVGSIGPADATTNGKMQGMSAQVTLTINFATGGITGTLTNFMSAINGATPTSADLVAMPITGTLNLASRQFLSGALVAAGNTGAAGTGDGVLEGQMVGTASQNVSQVVGRLRFSTTDNRRVLLAFGAR